MKNAKLVVVFAVFLIGGAWLYQFNYEPPILMYHHIGVSTTDNPSVSFQAFERQMEFLKVHRYNVIPLEELIRLIKAKQPIPPKTVAITFDDGFVDNIDCAFPVLRRLHLPATVFMITDNINREGWLSEEDLKILDASDIAIGSHTASHVHIPNQTIEQVEKEIVQSKKKLESILGHPVTLFSYPAGGFTKTSRKMVEEAGYSGAVTTNWGIIKRHPYSLHRIKVNESARNLFNFWAKLSGLYHIGKRRVTPPS